MKKIILLFLLSVSFSFGQKNNCKSDSTCCVNGQNIISFQPALIGVLGSDAAFGFGIELERFVSPKVSFDIPVQLFMENNNYYSSYENNGTSFKGISLAPNLKLYPYGNNKSVTWSIGPGLRLATLKQYNYRYPNYDNYGNYLDYNYQRESKFFMGVEMKNALNINLKKLHFSISNSIGITYLPELSGIFMMGLNIGYKF